MPAKHFRSVAAIEAHDMVMANRLPDRHRRSSLDSRFCCRCAEDIESPMNSRNQGCELICRNLIASQIRADNFSRKHAVHGQFIVVGHLVSAFIVRQTFGTASEDSGYTLLCQKNRGGGVQMGPIIDGTIQQPVARRRLAGPILPVVEDEDPLRGDFSPVILSPLHSYDEGRPMVHRSATRRRLADADARQ